MNAHHAVPDLTQPQLFLDDTWIADSLRVQRTYRQARKFPDPVIAADRPWERFACTAYGSALYRDEGFHIWYTTWTRDSVPKVCYARSDDGVNFEKPALGICEFDGSKDNNICLMADAGGYIDNIGIIEDPEDAEWPLKAIFWQGVRDHPDLCGLVACRSRDGIHWDKTPGMVLPRWGDRTNVFAAKVDGKYVILGRAPDNPYDCRVVFRTESEDLVHWSEPELILKPDPEDDAHVEIYSAQAFRYESLYLGFIERMHMVPDKLDSELMYSHDSHQWRRMRPRQAFIPWGVRDRWDSVWLSMLSNGPIRYRNRLWFYYSGRSAAHAAPYPLNHGAVGLALLRPDGFVSLQAKEREGWFVTPTVEWLDLDLLVNADPRRDVTAHPQFCGGEVRVEVRDEHNHPVEGYTRDECTPITRNTVTSPDARAPVSWSEQRSMRALAGRRVRLAFTLRDAHLYSFVAAEAAPKAEGGI